MFVISFKIQPISLNCCFVDSRTFSLTRMITSCSTDQTETNSLPTYTMSKKGFCPHSNSECILVISLRAFVVNSHIRISKNEPFSQTSHLADTQVSSNDKRRQRNTGIIINWPKRRRIQFLWKMWNSK